jgi:filamentous hemagglutinin family protein
MLPNYNLPGWFFLCFLATTSLSQAQIIPDNTLGKESSVVRQDNIGGTPSDVIEGGAIRGSNLFHSFSKFNVEDGRGAYFENPTKIDNILSRVTGSDPSNILGKLGILGDANLFLINPNGIIFGTNAQLDLRGSFVASTADSIVFDNGFEFSASNPQSPPLLIVNLPIGLRFGRTPGKIINRSIVEDLVTKENIGLQVQLGKTIALIGGDFSMEGGTISAPGARIELGSVAGNNLVHLTPISFGWALGYEGVENFQDIQLSQGAFASTTGESGGDIQLYGRRININSGSVTTLGLGENSAGNITLNASESVKLDGGDLTSSAIAPKAKGRSGDIEVTTGKLIVNNLSFINATSYGAGRGGNIFVNATKSIEVNGEGRLALISTQATNTGSAGNLSVTTKQLFLHDGGQLASSTSGPGNAGIVNVDASESVEVSGSGVFNNQIRSSGLFARTTAGLRNLINGKGGDLIINTGRLVVKNGGIISVAAVNGSTGQAGNLIIKANSLTLNSGTISAETGKSGIAEGANITLQIRDLLSLQNESLISATAFGSANGGNILIDPTFVLLFPSTGPNGSDIIAKADRGKGGNIRIDAQGIFGTAERKAEKGNRSNDIDASSEFGASGQVQLTSTVDPNQGVTQIPETVVDPNALVAQSPCKRGSQSQFTRTGRGGLPPNLSDDFSGGATQVGLVKPAPSIVAEAQKTSSDPGPSENQTSKVENSIVPAQGWSFKDNGEVVLTAYNPVVTGDQRLQENPFGCPAF